MVCSCWFTVPEVHSSESHKFIYVPVDATRAPLSPAAAIAVGYMYISLYKYITLYYKYSIHVMCKKVKCTLVQVLRLCTGRTAHRESRGIALPFHDHGTRRGLGVSVTPRPLFTPGKDTIPIVQEARCPQGRSGQVRKNPPPSGIDPRTVQPVVSRYTD